MLKNVQQKMNVKFSLVGIFNIISAGLTMLNGRARENFALG
jgi:hypothetical protein